MTELLKHTNAEQTNSSGSSEKAGRFVYVIASTVFVTRH